MMSGDLNFLRMAREHVWAEIREREAEIAAAAATIARLTPEVAQLRAMAAAGGITEDGQ